jgi:predicted site-specific integrase-resolvase
MTEPDTPTTIVEEATQLWLDLHQVAELAGCCYATAWRAAKSGELPGVRRGKAGRWRIRYEDAYEWSHNHGE